MRAVRGDGKIYYSEGEKMKLCMDCRFLEPDKYFVDENMAIRYGYCAKTAKVSLVDGSRIITQASLARSPDAACGTDAKLWEAKND